MLRSIALALFVTSAATIAARAEIVNHTDIDGVAALPQSTMNAIGQQRWLFTHASVGGNMIDGMNDLRAADSNRFRLLPTALGYNSVGLRANNPPVPTVAGRIYDCSRGNPGWEDKFTIFDNSVRISGWHDTVVDAVMDKLCYIDQTADAGQYLTRMAALETSYPNTVFVYTTMPLTTDEDDDNTLRNQYNAAVRSYCLAHDRLLFDIADIEAFDAGGTQYTFIRGGQTCQKLYTGYTSDGGHLNTAGRQRVAKGWYAVAATLVETSTLPSLTLSVINGSRGAVTLNPEPGNADAPTYPAGTVVTLTATPIEGRSFRQWEVYDPNYPSDAGHAIIDANTTLTLVMDTDKQVAAVFEGGSSVPCLPGLLFVIGLGVIAWPRRCARQRVLLNPSETSRM